MYAERRTHQTTHWIYDVLHFHFSINDIDFTGKLTHPVRVKLRGVAAKESWSKSNLDMRTFRTSIDGVLDVDGHFILPEGTQVGQHCHLELKYRTKRQKRGLRGISPRLRVLSRTAVQFQ